MLNPKLFSYIKLYTFFYVQGAPHFGEACASPCALSLGPRRPRRLGGPSAFNNIDWVNWTGDISKHDGVLWESWSWHGGFWHVLRSELRQRPWLRVGKSNWFVKFVCTEEECFESIFLANDSRNSQDQGSCFEVIMIYSLLVYV